MVANDEPNSTAADFSWAWARHRYRLLGAAAAVGVGAVGWLVDADRSTVAAVAAATPVLIGQDGVRNLAWTRRRPELAVGLDLVWLVVTAGLLGAVAAAGAVGPAPVVMSWLAGGIFSGLVASRLVGRLLADGDAAADRVQSTRPGHDPGGSARRSPGRAGPITDEQLHRRRHSHAILVGARNLLPIAVATLIAPAPAGLLKAGLLPFTPMLTLFGGLRLVVLPAMQRAAEAGSAAGGRSRLDRLVGRLVGWYVTVATVGALLTIALVDVVSDAGAADAVIGPEVVRWGGVVAVLTVIVRPVAEAAAFGSRVIPTRRIRVVQMAAEWTGVFAAVALAGAEQAIVGWAIGMAAGGLVWVLIGLAPGRHRPRVERGS